MKGDTVKLLSDDDGSRKRGVPRGHLARDITQDSVFFSSCLFWNLPDGEAPFLSLDDNGDCVSSFDETAQVLNHAGVDGALERSCSFLFLLKRGALACVIFERVGSSTSRVHQCAEAPAPSRGSTMHVLTTSFPSLCVCVFFEHVLVGFCSIHRACGRRTPEFGTGAQCAMLHRRSRARRLAASSYIVCRVDLVSASQEVDASVSQAARSSLEAGTCAFEAARQGKTAVVTVVPNQTDHRIRQASSTSQTRQ